MCPNYSLTELRRRREAGEKMESNFLIVLAPLSGKGTQPDNEALRHFTRLVELTVKQSRNQLLAAQCVNSYANVRWGLSSLV